MSVKRLIATLSLTVALGNQVSFAGEASLVRGHSHNDYDQRHPLHDAIDQRFYSVEADIWLRDGKILVSHMGWSFKGSLEDLYLTPLQKLVDRLGSVHGDGRTFYLWVDLKDGSAQLRAKLHQLLEKFPMLTIFGGKGASAGAVTVILTGDEESKSKFVNEHSIRRACRDSNDLNERDSQGDDRWSWYALKWSDYIHWNGNGPIGASERQRLERLVALAHAKGRRLRFWDVPRNEAVWKTALEAGAEQLSTDDLSKMHSFLEHLEDQWTLWQKRKNQNLTKS